MSLTCTHTYSAALIGCGKADNIAANHTTAGCRIGYIHGQAYHDYPCTILVAAADSNEDNLNACLKHHDIQQGYLDYKEMILEVKPDILSICTYVGSHDEIIKQAAEAGVKGIICENPFVNSPAELVKVCQLVKKTGIKIAIAHQRTMLPIIERARELYNNGTVGQRMITTYGCDEGYLSETGAHAIDMIRYIHNDDLVEWVMGQARVHDKRAFGHAVEEHASSYFKFKNGGVVLIDAGHALAAPYEIVLQGTEGALRLEPNLCKLHIDTPTGRVTEAFTQYPIDGLWKNRDLWAKIVSEMIQWIEGGEPATLGLPRTLGTAELNLATYLSVIHRDRIDLPLANDLLKLDQWPVEALTQKKCCY